MRNASPPLLTLLALATLSTAASATTLPAGDFVMAIVSANQSCCQVVDLDAATLAATVISSGGYLSMPGDITVTAGGAILVTVAPTGLVRIAPGDGAQTVLASPATFGGDTPAGVTAAGERIYLSLQGTDPRVVEIDENGAVLRTVTRGGLLTLPAGMAVGPDGALYVCETIPLMALAGGALVRVDLATGTQTLVASGEPLYGPFQLAFAADGSIWSVQHGIASTRRQGCVVRTDPGTGASEVVPFGNCRAQGIAIRPDGRTAIADCSPVHGDCAYPYTRIYPSGLSAPAGLGGPLAVVPATTVPARSTSWGNVKILYR